MTTVRLIEYRESVKKVAGDEMQRTWQIEVGPFASHVRKLLS
jgi:hypothetical protein